MSNVKEILELLREKGVKRATFSAGGELAEVEFFGPESPTHGIETAGETDRPPARDDGTGPYLHALAQLQAKRFVTRDAVPEGNA